MSARAERLVKDGFLPVKKAYEYLGISKTSMYELIAANVISHAKFRGRIVVPIQALRDYAAARLVIGKVA